MRYCRQVRAQHLKEDQKSQWRFCVILSASPCPALKRRTTISMRVSCGTVGKFHLKTVLCGTVDSVLFLFFLFLFFFCFSFVFIFERKYQWRCCAVLSTLSCFCFYFLIFVFSYFFLFFVFERKPQWRWSALLSASPCQALKRRQTKLNAGFVRYCRQVPSKDLKS